jgi:GxxExxY protein
MRESRDENRVAGADAEGSGQSRGHGPVTFEHDALTHQVIGAAIEVHRVLGPGFGENVYEAALCVELTARSVPYVSQHPFDLNYRGVVVGSGRMDLLVNETLIVELKSVDSVSPVHVAQLLSYLRATGIRTGLLINFNEAVLKQGIRRLSL